MSPRLVSRQRIRFAPTIALLEQRLVPAFSEFIDPHPAPGNQFGATVLPLSTGNVLVTSPFDDAGGTDAGAVYLFNGKSGSLISTLTGSHANDRIGSGVVLPLISGNFVISSPTWDNGGAADAGAVTWGDGATGVSGVVSAANSLVGSTAGDGVGFSVTSLSNGNYVVGSPFWDNGATADAGAATWGNGAIGVRGTVSVANSMTGSKTGDRVSGLFVYPGGGGEELVASPPNYMSESGIVALPNGNYVVVSAYWDNGAASDAGAVTWANGIVPFAAPVSVDNSLVGSSSADLVGNNYRSVISAGGSGKLSFAGVTVLSNSNYVVSSRHWKNSSAADAGAVTWANGTTGVSGVVNSGNSLVGVSPNDALGFDLAVTPLANGNYVVGSPSWDNGGVADIGAVTWGSGSSGVAGVISAANSLIGSNSYDRVGEYGVTVLPNGNYVVASPFWDNGGVADVGAVTWGNGSSGVVGVVSAANSLVGSTSKDRVGQLGVTALPSGNYVVASPFWDRGGLEDAGAVTWGSGLAGAIGTVSDANSLVGGNAFDIIGYLGSKVLLNGNYVVVSPYWDNGGLANAGAVTWGSGTTGVSGLVGPANSLVGSSPGDVVGSVDGYSSGIIPLSNGNYIVHSGLWDSGSTIDVGAVTWGSGTNGVVGVVSSSNSLVGSTAKDQIGSSGSYWSSVKALPNGNYIVQSSLWDNGPIANAGAVTWGNGTSGVSGVVSLANSLVGSAPNDQVGSTGIIVLTNGNYVVCSGLWDNGSTADAGAVTWCFGGAAYFGSINAANSLVGSSSADQVGGGGVAALSNGNYVVNSLSWDNGALLNAGAVTWADGALGISGTITPTNSAVGLAANTGLQYGIAPDDVNRTFHSRFFTEGGGRVRVGSQVVGFATRPPSVVSAVLGDGTNQRSMVKQLVVTFSEPVNFTGSIVDAFKVTRLGNGGTLGDVTLTAMPAVGPVTSATITFSGALTQLGSLIDGRYNLTIDATKVWGAAGALDGDDDHLAGGDYVVFGTTANKWYRLFGDANGDGIVDGADFLAFRTVVGLYLGDATFNAAFDVNGDGFIDNLDFIAFRLRLGMTP